MQRNPLSWLPWIIPRLRIEGRHGFSTLAVCHLLLHPIALGSELSPLELLASIPHSRPRLAFNRTDPTHGAAGPKPRNRTVECLESDEHRSKGSLEGPAAGSSASDRRRRRRNSGGDL